MQTREKREEISEAIASHFLRHKHDGKPALRRRKPRSKAPKPARIVAYDFETTRIKVGTPRPLYLTAHGADFSYQAPVRDMAGLTRTLRTQFLTEENLGVSFVAWNGNRFDAYIIAAALIREDDLILMPYLTKSKSLRGLRVIRACDKDNRNAKCWQFLDGIAMTGLAGISLAKFVETFAPDFPKLTGVIDFEREEFDPENKTHCDYAMRDSEGLYHAMTRAQQIMIETFDAPLAVTMGGTCIKIFAQNIPEGVIVETLVPDLDSIITRFVLRGGYCYCARRYFGPVWKYDLNQAYAAAMRETDLPCGEPTRISGRIPSHAQIFVARITATNPSNAIPFYCRELDSAGRLRSVFATTEISDTWITSVEYFQLLSEGWQIKTREVWVWPKGFRMTHFVDTLEHLRTTCDGGPKGAIGTMVKATGNHAYGKTCERIEPLQYLLAYECPDDCLPFYGDGSDPLEHVYYRLDEDRKPKDYHQPHIGAFITARVRMVVRRAALLDPASWLYADTDCVIFSSNMTAKLDIDSARYGAWKIEEEGAIYQIIAKKVYTEVSDAPSDKKKRSSKGLNVKRLTDDDFSRWYEGAPPVQDQVQVRHFLDVMRGAEMFRHQTRKGTRIESVHFGD